MFGARVERLGPAPAAYASALVGYRRLGTAAWSVAGADGLARTIQWYRDHRGAIAERERAAREAREAVSGPGGAR